MEGPTPIGLTFGKSSLTERVFILRGMDIK